MEEVKIKLAYYARSVYEGDIVTVSVEHENGITEVEFTRRKSWSHKKYAEKAMEKLGLRPEAFFHYGWEIKD